jgi:SAM-dependent methyltransferase
MAPSSLGALAQGRSEARPARGGAIWEVLEARSASAGRACLPLAGGKILSGMSPEEYLLADQPSELERLQLQSRVWEPSGRQLLSRIGDGSGGRALDVGCGALGWLRILGEWVGASGQVVGTDIDVSLLDAARSFLAAEGISNVELVVDDLFDSRLEPQSFDLVHARFVIAPLGRGPEQAASHRRLLRPGGSLVLEEWDLGSWHFNPPAPAAERLIRLLSEIFAAQGGEAGRGLPELLREIGIEEPEIDAHVIALKPGHPYLLLPLQFSTALESRLLETLSGDALASVRRKAESELAEPDRWGTTFTLIQSWGTLEG